VTSHFRLLIVLFTGISFFLIGLEILFFVWVLFDYFNTKNAYTINLRPKNKLAGIYAFVIFLPLIIIVGIIGEYFLGEFEKQNSVNQLKKHSDLAFSFIFSVLILSPIAEEFYFRKILFNEICLHYGPFLAVLLTALLFSAVHFNIYAFPILFVLGLSLGVVKIFSANLLNSVLCHSFFNLFMLSQIIN